MLATDVLVTAAAAAARSPIVIPPRFCGPPGTGNGGFVAGRLAAATALTGAVEVTLRRPTPLSTRLWVECDRARARWTLAAHAGEVVAEARAPQAAIGCEPPVRPRAAELRRAGERTDHPFPGCFVCGPERAHGDGLRIEPMVLEGGVAVAAPWCPPADLADAAGVVDAAVVWAALDCPGYFAIVGEGALRPMLLGRMTAQIAAPLCAGERYAVIAWRLASEGRRHETETALLDAAGTVRACSRQVWIEPRAV
jgi:hypothetical protein